MIATPYTDVPIEPGMAFAWNPSMTGAKSEETFVLLGAGGSAAGDARVTPLAAA